MQCVILLFIFIPSDPLLSFPCATEPSRLPLLVSGTVYHSTSLLHLRCLSFGHASRLISSPCPTPVRDHEQSRPRSDTCHFGHLNRSCYLLTYLLFSFPEAAPSTLWQLGSLGKRCKMPQLGPGRNQCIIPKHCKLDSVLVYLHHVNRVVLPLSQHHKHGIQYCYYYYLCEELL